MTVLQSAASIATHEACPTLKAVPLTSNEAADLRRSHEQDFRVCRMPDRPSKLAHVNFAHLFMHLPPRPDRVTVFCCNRQGAAARGDVLWRTRTFCPLTASGYSLGRSDRGAHEPEAGVD